MNRQFTLRAIIMTALGTTIIGIGITPILLQQQSAYAKKAVTNPNRSGDPAKIATSGDNIYIAWGSNNTGHPDIMFRASIDGGKTFGEKINLSNTSNVDSVDREIAASGDHVYVSWWERNATSNQPVLRISNDNGKTFGEILRLSTNGSIGSSGSG